MNKACFVDGAKFRNEFIDLPVSSEEIMKKISDFEVLVLRNVFDAKEMTALKNRLAKYAEANAPQNPPIAPGAPNFYRLDKNPEKSTLKRISRAFSSFYWNELDIAGERPYLKALARLRNRLVGLADDYAFYGVEDGHISSPTILQYPVGGGYLQSHVDPPSKQKVVVVAILSERGVDYQSGGVYVEDPKGENRVLVDELMGPGDVYLMNPAARHGVAPIDPEKTLDFDSSAGRWMMFSTLVSHASLYGQKTEGLVAY